MLGIDETRRGRTRWEQDPDAGKWKLTRDRWHPGFVDTLGAGGLLGQVEGRTWPSWPGCPPRPDLETAHPPRHHRRASHLPGRRAHRSPGATVVVDHFHLVQLANKMLSLVRRRTTSQVRGGRRRATDPEWKARRRLLRNREDLTNEQCERMWNPCSTRGRSGRRS